MSHKALFTKMMIKHHFIEILTWKPSKSVPVVAISWIITQPSIYRVIVYFLLCHESLNYWPVNIFDYWLTLYHGLVSCFPVKNTQALTNMRDNDERRGYATKVKMRHGLAILYSNNSFVYGQKHKVCILLFLFFFDQNWADLVKFFVWNKNASPRATPFKEYC